jgi:TRAP-type uncharacterized transport system fused permease subunit
MTNNPNQQQAAAVENAAAGRGGLSQAELDELVASSDTGGRGTTGSVGIFLTCVALAWSLFQLWIASPIPFMVGFGVFNDTESRSIHLAFAIFLAFAAFPAARTKFQLGLGVIVPLVLAFLFMSGSKDGTATWWIPIVALALVACVVLGSPKDRIPVWEWALAIIGSLAALYLFVFYRDISGRVGAPIQQDFVVAVIGLILLLEATRRALGPALMIVATVFLAYTVLGPHMPGIIAHKGNNLSEIVNHQWITTEGVFGIALGVSAGIIVGAVSQNGVGSALADVVEVLSGGNILAILFLTAVLSLILGMGLPTTANYIVVSALLAPVIVTLGQQNGLIVPLIAVHLFVFYFGIMADVTPPVGLASFAAAAVSGGDPIKTGVVAFFYSLRTAALPFLFIFNTELLLIGVGWGQGIFVFVVATVAMLLFAAATQGWFVAKNRIYESLALLLIAFTLFRPGFWMDMLSPPYAEDAPIEIAAAALAAPVGEDLRLRVAGMNDLGDPIEFVAILPIEEGATGEERLENAGLMFRDEGGAMFVDDVVFGSAAADAGLDWDQQVLRVLRPIPQPSKYLMFLPALALLALIVFMQRGRVANAARRPTEA